MSGCGAVVAVKMGYPIGECFRQSQRDCVTQPRVGAPSPYPGCAAKNVPLPQRGCIISFQTPRTVTQPFQGCAAILRGTQGSSGTRNPGLSDGIPLGFTGIGLARPGACL